jgi:hypothetical protein
MTVKVRQVKKSYKVKGSAKQKLAIKKVMENRGMAISKAMREVGYPDVTAKNPKNLTESKAWKEIMDEILPEEYVAEQHKKLFEMKNVQTMKFDIVVSENEIKEIFNQSGLHLVKIKKLIYKSSSKKEDDKEWIAYYIVNDSFALKSALDMAHKIRGKYSDENPLDPNSNLKMIVINKSVTINNIKK